MDQLNWGGSLRKRDKFTYNFDLARTLQSTSSATVPPERHQPEATVPSTQTTGTDRLLTMSNKSQLLISVSGKKGRQLFRKTNISYHLIRTRIRTHRCVYQGIKNNHLWENFACCFLKTSVSRSALLPY